MACIIDKELQLKLFGVVYKELEEAAKSSTPSFSLKPYMKSFYTEMIQAGLSKENALKYSMFIPTAIRRASGLNLDFFGMVDAKDIALTEKSFNQLSDVAEYLNINESSKKSVKSKLKDAVNQPVELSEDEVESMKYALESNHLTGFLNHPMGDVISPGKFVKNVKSGKYDYVPTKKSNLTLPVLTKQALIDKMSRNYLADGYKLKAVKGDFIPVENYIEDSSDTVFADKVNTNEPQATDSYKNGVILIVTDQEGTPLKFDEEGNESSDGLYVHFNLPNIRQGKDSRKFIQQSDDMSNKTGFDQVKLQALSKKFRGEQTVIRQAVKDGNEVLLDITGANEGYPNLSVDKKTRKKRTTTELVKELSELDVKFKVDLATIQGRTNPVLVINNKFYKKEEINDAQIYKRKLSSSPETLQKVKDILTKDFKWVDEFGTESDFKANNRKNVLRSFTYIKGLNIKNAKDGFIVKYENDEYKNDDPALLNLLDKILPDALIHLEHAKLNKQFTDITLKGDIFETEVKDYNQFVFDNSDIQMTLVNGSESIKELPSIYYNLSSDAIIEAHDSKIKNEIAVQKGDAEIESIKDDKVKEIIKQAQSQIKSKKKNFNFGDDASLLDKKKLISNEATPEQIKKAKEWYDNSPISKYITLEELMYVVNSDKFADFNLHGIRLFKGSNYTDLYHESFHAFSQLFLSKEDKIALYKELGKKKGTFKTYKGETKEYAEADYLELEELLAEDFRQYVLSGASNVLKGSTKRNTIFRRMYNYLKYIFSSQSYSDYVANANDLTANSKVKELYDQLYTGNINTNNYSLNNAIFEKVNKTKIEVEDPSLSVDFDNEKSIQVVETLDNLIADFIESIVATNGAKMTNAFFRNPVFIAHAYDYATEMLNQRKAEYIKALGKTKDAATKLEIGNKVAMLQSITNNMLIKDALTGETTKGIVAFHKNHSQVLDISDKVFDSEELAKRTDKDFETSLPDWEARGNELSAEELAANEVLFAIKTIPSRDKNDVDTFGFAKRADYKLMFFKILDTLKGTRDLDVMLTKLNKLSKTYPEIKSLLARLGDPNTDNKGLFSFQTKFVDAFNKSHVKLMSLNINKTEAGVEVIMGAVSSRINNVLKDLNSNFRNSEETGFILRDYDDLNYLDKESVVTVFGKTFKDKTGNTAYELNKSKEIEFINAIGIPLEKSKEAIDGLNLINTGELFNFIYKLSNHNPLYKSNAGEVKIQDLSGFGMLYKNFGITGTSAKTSHQGATIKKLVDLHARTSDTYASFSVTNAENEMQQETTINASINVMVNSINDSKSLADLVSKPEFKHLDPSNNEFTLYSEMLSRVFDMSDPKKGYPKKPNGSLNLVNLSGVQFVENDEFQAGVATSKLDKSSKVHYDIMSMLNFFKPELMRHADKSGSFSLTAGNKLYVELKDYENSTYADSKTRNYFYKYIQVELDTIKNRDKYKNVENAYSNAKNFQIFAGILDNDTRNEIKEMEGDFFDLVSNKISKNVTKELRAKVDRQLMSYIEKRSEVVKKSTDPRLALDVTTPFKDKNLIFKAFTVNTMIHNFETLHLLYGNPVQYKHHKDDFHKRNAPIASGGRLFRSDKHALNHINNRLNTPIKDRVPSLAHTNDNWKEFRINEDKVVNTAVFADREFPSLYVEEYKQAFKEFYINDKKLSETKAKKLAERDVQAYKEMNSGDAQGYITMDAYKALSILSGKWSDEQEFLYDKIVNGETVHPSKISEFFPIRKYQYYGPLATEESLTALHKYSLFPLIPQVIKGKKLETLNDRLMKQGMGIGMFQSASKISTISEKGNIDRAYDENGQFIKEGNFTNNPIILDYLKDQVDTHSHAKNTVSLPTQIRKLILSGLSSDGKFKSKDHEELALKFESALKNLQDRKREELYDELDITTESTKTPKEKVETILNYLKRELSRQDLAEHELEELEVSNSKDLIEDLSLSPSSAKLEKIIIALINRKLVKYNISGEGLIQASSIMTEPQSLSRDYSNPTKEDLDKFGSNELRFYRRGKDNTLGMEVKLPLQGDFKKLLKAKDLNGKIIKSIERLNEVITDPAWLEENEDLITLTGVRIPTQEINSAEFMIVKEFIDPAVSNAIIPPLEIVSKTGSDFDVDKMFAMFPNIFVANGKAHLYDSSIETSKTKSELESELEKLRAKKSKTLNESLVKVNTLLSINTPGEESNFRKTLNNEFEEIKSELEITNEEIKKLEKGKISLQVKLNNATSANEKSKLKEEIKNQSAEIEQNYDYIEDLLGDKEGLKEISKLNKEALNTINEASAQLQIQINSFNTKALENDLIFSIRDILAFKDNFLNLIKPIDGTDVKDLATGELAQYSGLESFGPEATKIIDPIYNVDKHQSNGIGKEALGIGAIFNTYNAVINRVGGYVESKFGTSKTLIAMLDGLTKEQIVKKYPRNAKGMLLNKSKIKDFLVYFSHNKTKDGKISISSEFDVNNEYRIGDLISQLMNGWVDVAKDDWVFKIQGNKEVAPTLMTMLKLGIPLKTVGYFVSNPLIAEYVKEQKILTSPLNPGRNIEQVRSFAAARVINNFASHNSRTLLDSFGKTDPKALEIFIKENIGNFPKLSGEAQIKEMKKAFSTKSSNFTHALFYNFLQYEQLSSDITALTTSTNFDTTKTATYLESYVKDKRASTLSDKSLLSSDMLEAIYKESIVSNFNIIDDLKRIVQPIFKLRNNDNLNDYLAEIATRNTAVPKGFEKMYNKDLIKTGEVIKNDLMVATVQKGLHYLGDLQSPEPSKNYLGARGFEVVLTENENGIEFKDGVAHLDIESIIIKFNSLNKSASFNKYFPNIDAYAKYMYERQIAFNSLPKKREESDKEYNKRMRKVALYKSNNIYSMFFNPDINYPKVLLNVIKSNKDELKLKYSIIDQFFKSSYEISKNTYINNLELKTRKLDDSVLVTRYHNELKDLMNPNVIKLENAQENAKLSELFSKLPMFVINQNGYNTASNYGLSRIIDASMIKNLIRNEKEYYEFVSAPYNQGFLLQFMENNSNKALRYRYKNYLTSTKYFKQDSDNSYAQNESIPGVVLDFSDSDQDVVLKERGKKLLNKQDVNSFLSYFKKSEVLPTEFFTTSSKLSEFFSSSSGKKQGIPDYTKWILNTNNLYDLVVVDESRDDAGIILIDNVDLRTGYQYNDVIDNIQQQEGVKLSIENSKIKKEPHWKKDQQMANASAKAIAKQTLSNKKNYRSSTGAYLEAIGGASTSFTSEDSVWVFGAGTWASSEQDIQKDFDEYYKPTIDQAIASGVTTFNIGIASGIDSKATTYLKSKGFTVNTKDKWNEITTTQLQFGVKPETSAEGLLQSSSKQLKLDFSEDDIYESKDVLKEYTNSEISNILRSEDKEFIEDYLGQEVSREETFYEEGKAQRIFYTYGIIDNVSANDGSAIRRLLDLENTLVGIPNIEVNMGTMERFNKAKFSKSGVYLKNNDIAILMKDSLGNEIKSLDDYGYARKNEIISNFLSKHDLSKSVAEGYINNAIKENPELTIKKIKECY